MAPIKNIRFSKGKFHLILLSYILLILLFQTKSSSIYSLQDFKYMKTFELETEDILMCTEKGIFLRQKTSEELISFEETIFESYISREDFDYVTISRIEQGDRYIIVLYKTIIFAFTFDGNYCARKDINLNPGGTIYTLVPTKMSQAHNFDEYHFVIGYINNNAQNRFILSQCYLQKRTSDNTYDFVIGEDTSLIFPNSNDADLITHKGFSCQKMYSGDYYNVLTCYFFINNKLAISSFDLDSFSIIDELYYISEEENQPIYINSLLSNDRTKTLICYLSQWSLAKCEKYDINTNTISTITFNNEIVCENSFFTTEVMYKSIKADEYFYGCLGNSLDLALIKFDSNFEIENILYNNVYYYNGNKCETLSITNSLNKTDYSLFLGCDSQGVLYKDDLPGGFAPRIQTQEIPTTFKIDSTLLQEISTIPATSMITTILTTSKISPLSTVKADNEKYTLIVNEPTQLTINSFYSSELRDIPHPHHINTDNIFGSTEIIKDWNYNQISEGMNISTEYEYNTYYNTYYSFMEKNGTCSEDFFYKNTLTNECLYSCNSEDLLNEICKINIVTNSKINDITNDIRNLIKKKI